MSTPALPPPDPAFLDSLAETLGGAWASPLPENPAATARAAIDALQPGDLIETMLAARMIAAHHAAMDSFRRAMRPDTDNAEAVRLRSNAVAVGRSFDAAEGILRKRRAPAEQPAQSGARAAPSRQPYCAPPAESTVQDDLARFTPEEIAAAEHELDTDPVKLQQEELAKRIPLHRWQDMTMEERRIAYAPSAPHTPAQLAVMAARMAASNRAPPLPGQASLTGPVPTLPAATCPDFVTIPSTSGHTSGDGPA